MKQQMHIVCLRSVRYSDSKYILSAYSLEAGRVSFLMNDGKGREAVRRRALTQPLALVECVADIVPGRDIHRMGDMRALAPLSGMRSNPVKCAVALFIAETLGSLLRESQSEPGLWKFVEQAIIALDGMDSRKTANFHLWFLYGLGRFLGISPDVGGYSPGEVFDMADGIFRKTAPMHRDFISSEQAASVAMLERMTLDNMHLFRFTREQRNATLDGILRYLSMHYAPLSGLKSLDILRTLF